MELRTQKLGIRFLREDDWRSLLSIWEDFNRSSYAQYDVSHTTDASEVKRMASRWAAASPQMEHLFFSVCLDGKMIGYVDFHKNNSGYECGYCFHSNAHGKGYAKESLQALMEALSKNSGTCFTAGTALNNLPSVRLLYSLGFQKAKEEPVSFYKDTDGNDIFFTGGVFVNSFQTNHPA